MAVPSVFVAMMEYCPASSLEMAEMVSIPPVRVKLPMSPGFTMTPARFNTYELLSGFATAVRSRTRLSPDFITTVRFLLRNSGLTVN